MGWKKGRIGLKDASGRFIKEGQILEPMIIDPKTKRFIKKGS
jgi:hypothetical protein